MNSFTTKQESSNFQISPHGSKNNLLPKTHQKSKSGVSQIVSPRSLISTLNKNTLAHVESNTQLTNNNTTRKAMRELSQESLHSVQQPPRLNAKY